MSVRILTFKSALLPPRSRAPERTATPHPAQKPERTPKPSQAKLQQNRTSHVTPHAPNKFPAQPSHHSLHPACNPQPPNDRAQHLHAAFSPAPRLLRPPPSHTVTFPARAPSTADKHGQNWKSKGEADAHGEFILVRAHTNLEVFFAGTGCASAKLLQKLGRQEAQGNPAAQRHMQRQLRTGECHLRGAYAQQR